MHRHLGLLVALLVASPSFAQPALPAGPAQASSPSLSVPPPVFTDAARRQALAAAYPQIDGLVSRAMERSKRPGGVVGLIVDGELVHVSGQGVQDLDSKRPVTADSVFRIASMTKSFTAMAILRLRDAGRLSLDDLAERHVPELKGLRYPTSDSPRLTIRHLLSHSEGFPEDNPWGDRQLGQSDAWMGEAMRAGIPFSTVPGTAYEYSNYGFAILGRIVQNVSGRPYDEFVTDEILRPLGMTSTTFEAARVDPARRTQGYDLVDGRHVALEPLPHGSFGAMGGLWTTAHDLAKYVAFLMSAWPPRDGPEAGPISRASAREMQQVTRHDRTTVGRASLDGPLRMSSGGYGYGLRISDDCDLGVSVSHGGGLPGYGSTMRWLPEHGVGFIAMSNLTYSGWTDVSREVFDLLRKTGGLARRVVQPSPRLLEVQRLVTQLVVKWDDSLAQRLAADNLFLDEPIERRRTALARLLETHGGCRPEPTPIDAENALRGRWQIPCDRGTLGIGVTLAPTAPPLVQLLQVRGVMPPGPALQHAIDTLLPLTARWDDAPLRELAPAVDIAAVARQFQLAGLQAGACTQGETLVGDGTRALFRLRCERADLLADVVLDTSTGRVTRINLMPDGSRGCVP